MVALHGGVGGVGTKLVQICSNRYILVSFCREGEGGLRVLTPRPPYGQPDRKICIRFFTTSLDIFENLYVYCN